MDYELFNFLLSVGFEYPKMNNIGRKLKNKELRLKRGLQLLETISNNSGLEMLLLKTHNVSVKTLPNDIDVLVRKEQIRDVLQIIRRLAKDAKIFVRSPWEMEIFIPDIAEIELTPNVMWFNTPFISEKLIFISPQKTEILGCNLLTTSNVCDFLTRSAHALFGHFCLRFDEYLHLQQILSSLGEKELRLALNEVEKMGWIESYIYFLEQLRRINEVFSVMRRGKLKNEFKIPIFPLKFRYTTLSKFFLRMLISKYRDKQITIIEIFRCVLYYLRHSFLIFVYYPLGSMYVRTRNYLRKAK
jgi:hypothetical protein